MPTSAPRSLIVDSDLEHSKLLADLLIELGLKPIACGSIEMAKEVLLQQRDAIAVAFIALDLPDGDGLSLLDDTDLLSSNTEVALMHDVDDPDRAERGIYMQASYFFCKPLDQGFLKGLVSDIRADWLTGTEPSSDDMSCAVDQFGLLRGSSPPMRKLFRTVRKLAPTEASVLLIGESGTGKELVAETLHLMSEHEGPFVAINCGAIPAELAESELFGHEKGSFSGADKQHAGCFERAQGGTLFLDEIGEMPLEMQVKLLRVLETGSYRRVGGEKSHTTNARVIAATNRDPKDAIEMGVLREDLYFRVAQFPLRLPPLRDRGSDGLGLAQHFLNQLNEKHGTGKVLTQEAQDGLLTYPWPGNVRELKSALERAYIMADEVLDNHHFPQEQVAQAIEGDYLRVSIGEPLEDTERKLILATLDAVDGNKKEAANQLGISLKTLYNRLNDYEDEAVSADVHKTG